jgi:transposase
MRDYRLTQQQIAALRAAHRATRDVREAYRINAVILLGRGRTPAEVAEALLLDADTVREYYKRYQAGGIEELLRMSFVGSEALLDAGQLAELDTHLRRHLYQTAEAVARYVAQRWHVHYSVSGMSAVLRRLGYCYKKAKLEPGKHPPAEVQEAFVEKYQKLKENKEAGAVIYFMDATHPQHNPALGRGWIKRGHTFSLASNTGRQRLNINGAINVEDLRAEVRFDETIDALSTIALLQALERAHPDAPRIIVICDNARYYKSKAVAAYLKDSRVQLEPLPPYCPNLNLIERFWKYFKGQVLCNRYYPTFSEFRCACRKFFAELDAHVPRLRTLLTERFQIFRDTAPESCIA